MNWEDLEPRKQAVQLKNLEICSIEELQAYIDELKSEIVRSEDMISKKMNVRQGAESLFRNER